MYTICISHNLSLVRDKAEQILGIFCYRAPHFVQKILGIFCYRATVIEWCKRAQQLVAHSQKETFMIISRVCHFVFGVRYRAVETHMMAKLCPSLSAKEPNN